MVTSKKYLLVSFVLVLYAAHGVNAASAGVGPRDVSVAVAPATSQTPSALGFFTPITPTDLAADFCPRTGEGYQPVELMEQKTQKGFVTNSQVSLPTAAALLPAIKFLADERTLPFQDGSAIANVKAAYGMLRSLLEYQIYLKANYDAFQRGEMTPVKPLSMSSIFCFNSGDLDGVKQTDSSGYTIDGGYTPLDDLKALFTGWAEESKKLGDIFKGNQVRVSLGAVEEAAVAAGVPAGAAASAKAAASALVEGFARGAEKAAGTESPSLFNPVASVRDNMIALYRYVAKVRDHIREFYDSYMAERDVKLQKDAERLKFSYDQAQAAAIDAVQRLSAEKQGAADAIAAEKRAKDAIQSLLDATTQQLEAEKRKTLEQARDLSAATGMQARPAGAAAGGPMGQASDYEHAFATLFARASELEGLLAKKDAQIGDTGLTVARVMAENATLRSTLRIYLDPKKV